MNLIGAMVADEGVPQNFVTRKPKNRRLPALVSRG